MWNLKKYSNNVAIIEDNSRKTTYAQLNTCCIKFASYIPKRSLIFNLCSNSLGGLIGYIGSLNNKIVPLMLDKDIDDGLLKNFIQQYDPDYIWVPEEQISKFDGEIVFRNWGYNLIKRKILQQKKLYSELAILLTTSGSTGSPKMVRQSYKNIQSNTEAIVQYLGLTAKERAITTLPMNYTYGLSIINTHLYVGATLLLTDKTLMEREFWNFFTQQCATSFGGVPYTYEMLNKLTFFRRSLPSLKTLTQAGGKLSPELHQKFAEYAQKNGKRFIVMYGQAEATARMAYLPAEKSLEKCGSMGLAIPEGKFTLLDESGNIISSPEIIGELVYQGPNVTLGYAQNFDDLAKGDEFHGVLHTGDMAKFDKDGFFYIVGRKKRFLKMFGNRIGLDETECLIKTAYPDIECACCGKDDLMYVFINNTNYCDNLKHFLAEKTKLNIAAFKIMSIPEIPKNDAGKIMYGKLEKYQC